MQGDSKGVYARRSHPDLRVMAARRALHEPRLDQLFAEPIVRQLMRADRIDEATIRRLLRLAAVARSTPRTRGVLAFAMGPLSLIGIRNAYNITMRTLRRCRH
jgi:hypothetical protein